MTVVWLEMTLIVALILLNGLFSLAEMALVSARKARLEQLAKDGHNRASLALDLANSPESFFPTIQIGITFIGILAGAFAGATIAELLAGYLAGYPYFARHSEALGVAVVVICITYLSLVIGELVPKRLALSHPERLACLVAPSIKRLSRLALPLVVLLNASTNILLRLFRVRSATEHSISEEEIKLLIDQGTRAGTFQEFEQDTIERVFRLADRRVAVLMTPRADIIWLDLSESEEESKRKIARHKYAFFPVAHEGLDNVVGVIRGKDLLSVVMEGRQFNLKEIIRRPLFVWETTPAVRVLELFKKSGTHIALVVDEYGAILGLVTFDDILRSVFEDIEDGEEGEKEIVRREDGSWLISGSLPLDEFMDFLEIKLSEEGRVGMNTVGGFVMTRIGSVPAEGQFFEWKGLRFEVVDMDGRRVDKILVSVAREKKS